MKSEKLRRSMSRLWRVCHGQDLIEYALAAGMVAVAAVAVMPGLGAAVNTVFSQISSLVTANIN